MGDPAGAQPGTPAPSSAPPPADADSPQSPAPGAQDARTGPASPGTRGRTLPVKPIGPPASRPSAAADPLGTGPGTPPQPSAGFKFRGRDFASPEEAERFYTEAEKTSGGRLKAAEERIKALEKQHQEADSNARGWWLAYQRLQQQGDPGSTAPAEPEKPWIDTIDWRFAEQLAQDDGVAAAMYWLAERMQERFDQQLKDQFDQRVAPMQQRFDQQGLESAVTQDFYALAGETGPDGAPLYPELHSSSPEAAAEVVRIWTGLPPRFTLDPSTRRQAIEYAVLKYRSANGTASGAATPPGPLPPSAAIARALGDGGAADALTGPGHPPPATGAPDPQAALRRAGARMQKLFVTTKSGHSLGFKRLPDAAEAS